MKNVQNILKDSNIDLTILRPTMIYGSLDDKNISTFIKMVDKFRIFDNNSMFIISYTFHVITKIIIL